MVMMRSRWSLLPLACCLISWVASSAVAAAGTTVNSLPGFDGPLPFSLETGYVEVKETTGVNLFYYFIHSEKDPEHDPLFLWMTGGPGCSSLCGLTYEIGPFQFSAQWHYRNGVPKLIYHPETWTKTNNIIFVILLWGQDSRTQPQRKDSSLWLVDHPQFLLNPLYIGGDSYGGMIIPVLTLAIDERNYLGEKPYFNLKGYLVGNPRTDKQFDEDAKIPFFHGMGLISNELYERAKETCSGKYSAPSNIQCVQSLKSINDCTKDINMVHILEPLCEGIFSPKIHNITEQDGTSRLMLESTAADDDLTTKGKGRDTLAGRRSIGIADSPSMRLPTALSSATSASGYSCEFFSSLGSDRASGYNRDGDVALPSDIGSISDRVEALTYAWPHTSGMMAAMGGEQWKIGKDAIMVLATLLQSISPRSALRCSQDGFQANLSDMIGKEARRAMVARRSRWSLLPLACCLVSWVASSPAAAAGTMVTSLPGFDGPLPFSLETGYVEVNKTTKVNLFYYFVRSEKDPEHDPLLVWLTGGPGCSSIYGLTHEIGPFQFTAQWYYRNGFPKLIYRPETWTKTNNIIFVDSPVGTGFSYATTEEGSKSSDTKAVKQLVVFLRKWLLDHPQFLLNPLYIGGDSYGGMIIPVLTLAIDESNYLGEKPYFNLKGYFAGNPRTDKQFDEDAKIPFFHGMGLISDELYERAKETCRGKYSAPSNTQCVQSLKDINDCTKDINMLHILEPLCEEIFSPKIHNTAEQDGTSRVMLESTAAADDLTKAAYIVLKIWVNDETVRENLGVRKGTVGDWKRCNYVGLHYVRDIHSTVEYHSTLMRKGYRALIYSGDHDAGFTFIGTQAWIRFLNLSVAEKWRPWYLAGQVAGFTTSYASNNLTYATVKGAGHTAPEYKPKECFAMFTRWISGKSL
uniref:Carboxypeptidase n=1 Tax=Leersia perrieri TaxID=77586 RepID=A0A0D9XRW5_9ORYZ